MKYSSVLAFLMQLFLCKAIYFSLCICLLKLCKGDNDRFLLVLEFCFVSMISVNAAFLYTHFKCHETVGCAQNMSRDNPVKRPDSVRGACRSENV